MAELIRAAGLSGYEQLAAELQVNVVRVARRAGLPLQALRNPSALIAYRSLMLVLEHSARESGCAHFGLRLSQRQGLDVLGPIAVVMEHASTVAEAIEFGSRYMFVHSPAIRFTIAAVPAQAGYSDLRFEIRAPHAAGRAQTIELSLGVMVRVLGLLSQGRVAPVLALVPHARLSEPAVYRQFLNCTCRFDQDHAAIRVATSALSQTLAGHNPMLGQLARSYLDTHHARPDRALSERVAALVREFIGTQRASREDIAAMLAMHPRTLHRRLADEDTAFEDIKDTVRRELFEQLLRRSAAPSLAQIAGMLGYSEQATFTRACRRWFGHPPSVLLQRGRAPLRRNAD